MRFVALSCWLLGGVLTLAGCDASKVSEKDINEQKEKISKLEKDLEAAKKEKENAIESASADARKEAEEKVADLEAKLQEERDQLGAMQDRYEFENEMVTNLQEMDDKIDRLEEQADEATGEREVELNKQIAGLKTKRDQLRDKLNELRAASGDTWANLKQETEEAWNDASSSVDDAMKNIKNKVNEELKDDEPKDGESTSPKADDGNPKADDGKAEDGTEGTTNENS